MIVGPMIVGVPTKAKADIAFARYHFMLLAQPTSVPWCRRFGKAFLGPDTTGHPSGGLAVVLIVTFDIAP